MRGVVAAGNMRQSTNDLPAFAGSRYKRRFFNDPFFYRNEFRICDKIASVLVRFELSGDLGARFEICKEIVYGTADRIPFALGICCNRSV